MDNQLTVKSENMFVATIQDKLHLATMLAKSSIIPDNFQGKPENCFIALDMAERMNMPFFSVVQNIYIVYGRPSWSSSFLISCFNTCGRFEPITYKFEGVPGTDNYGCRAVSKSLATNTNVDGTLITIAMAKAEGWYNKNGSKWKTMPEQMLRYRAAAFLIRATAPEISNGMLTSDEVIETEAYPVQTVEQVAAQVEKQIAAAPKTVVEMPAPTMNVPEPVVEKVASTPKKRPF